MALSRLHADEQLAWFRMRGPRWSRILENVLSAERWMRDTA